MPKVIMTVKLEGPVEGEEIIQAVQQVAGNDYREERNWIDDKTFFIIGRGGHTPYAHLVVVVGKDRTEMKIDPDAVYYDVAVKDESWPGLVHAVGYTDEDIRDSLVDFRTRLQAALLMIQKVV